MPRRVSITFALVGILVSDASRAEAATYEEKAYLMGLRACVRSRIYELSPVGTAELSLGRESWVGFERTTQSRKGRLKIGRDASLNNLQPSLRDLIMFHDVPRTRVP